MILAIYSLCQTREARWGAPLASHCSHATCALLVCPSICPCLSLLTAVHIIRKTGQVRVVPMATPFLLLPGIEFKIGPSVSHLVRLGWAKLSGEQFFTEPTRQGSSKRSAPEGNKTRYQRESCTGAKRSCTIIFSPQHGQVENSNRCCIMDAGIDHATATKRPHSSETSIAR